MRLVEVRRVSTEEQARDDRAGLLRQADQNRLTAERLGATIIEPPFVISDVCRENIVDTPEWVAIRRLIADPDVHIVVDQQDRLVAGLAGVQILMDCERTATRIFASNGEVDVTTFAGQVIGLLGAAIAADELRKIRHRVQGSKEVKRREGKCPSAAITLATGIAYIRLKQPNGQLTGRWTYNADIDRVKEVFRLVVHEGHRNWREVGRLTGFSGVTVRNILLNPIYKGLWYIDEKRTQGVAPIRSNGRRKDRPKVKRDPHEIIQQQVYRPVGLPVETGDTREEATVDETTWNAAQAVVEEKTAAYYRPRDPRGTSRFIYTGILWCSSCGTTVYGKTRPSSNGTRRDWYVCKTAATSRGRCPSGYLSRRMVNAALDRLFATVLCDERILSGLVRDALGAEQEDYSGHIQAALGGLNRLQARRAKLLDLYLDGTWGKADLDVNRTNLDDQIARQQQELRRLEQAQGSARTASALEGLKAVLVTLAEFEFWSPSDKRRIVKQFFPRVVVSKRGIENVVVQLPMEATVGSSTVPVPEHELPLTLEVGMSWEQLQAQPTMTEFGLPDRRFYTRRDMLHVLGWSDWMLTDRLRRGLLPEPSHRVGGKRAWTPDEVRAALARQDTEPKPYRWGLPRKPFYATPEVIRILGTCWQKLRYAIDTGRVTDCGQRDANGHRMWTEVEVEQALVAIGKGAAEPPRTCDAHDDAVNDPSVEDHQEAEDRSGTLSADLHDL